MLAGEPTAKGTGLGVPAGKEDPVEFDSSLTECSSMEGVAQVGGALQLMALIMALAAVSTDGSSFCMRLRAATRKLAMKYHHLHSRFTNRMIRVRQPLEPLGARPRCTSLASCLTASPLRLPSTVLGPRARVRPRCFVRRSLGTLLRWGVWLGRHTCYRTTQVSRSTAQAGRKPLTGEQIKGTADAVTSSKSPQCASVALRSSGQACEFPILKPEVSEILPQG